MTISVYPPYGSPSNPSTVTFGGTNVDAFGRLRVSEPFTLFDSQSRFAADIHYSYVTATGGTTSYNTNQSSVSLNVTTSSGSTALAQTVRVSRISRERACSACRRSSWAHPRRT